MKALRSIVTSDLRLKYVAFVDKTPDIDQTICHRHRIPEPAELWCQTKLIFCLGCHPVSGTLGPNWTKWAVLGSVCPSGQTCGSTPKQYFVMLFHSTFPT